MFSLTIETSGPAWKEDLPSEIARALRGVADRVEYDGSQCGIILDSKGNRIGSFVLIRDTAVEG